MIGDIKSNKQKKNKNKNKTTEGKINWSHAHITQLLNPIHVQVWFIVTLNVRA